MSKRRMNGHAAVEVSEPMASELDSNPAVRKAIMTRLNRAAETAPIALLFQIIQALEAD